MDWQGRAGTAWLVETRLGPAWQARHLAPHRMRGTAPCQAGRAVGQDGGLSDGAAAQHPTPPVVGGGGLGTAPQGKKTT
jgi:hypothetical protein